MEEAHGFRALINLERPQYTIEQIAGKMGKSPAYLTTRLKLADLTPTVVDAFYAEEIGVGHALLLAKLQPNQQEQALSACIRRSTTEVRSQPACCCPFATCNSGSTPTSCSPSKKLRNALPGSSPSRPVGVVADHYVITNLYYSSAMTDRPNPVFRTAGEVLLTGRMAIYGSQAEASEGIPGQWRLFLGEHPEVGGGASFYGASPCTGDRKIHYLSGVAQNSTGLVDGESLVLEAGEYAVVRVDEVALLRETWTWLLGTWLAASGRRERNAPEFERYTGISEAGVPVGPVEIWIPLESFVKGQGERRQRQQG